VFSHWRWLSRGKREVSGRFSKVVGLADLSGNRFAYALFDAGEIWVSDFSDRRRPQTQRYPAGLQPYDGLVTPDGRYYLANILDVSERREVERLKKEFVSTVSHELRTPVTVLRGSLEALCDGVAQPGAPTSTVTVLPTFTPSYTPTVTATATHKQT